VPPDSLFHAPRQPVAAVALRLSSALWLESLTAGSGRSPLDGDHASRRLLSRGSKSTTAQRKSTSMLPKRVRRFGDPSRACHALPRRRSCFCFAAVHQDATGGTTKPGIGGAQRELAAIEPEVGTLGSVQHVAVSSGVSSSRDPSVCVLTHPRLIFGILPSPEGDDLCGRERRRFARWRRRCWDDACDEVAHRPRGVDRDGVANGASEKSASDHRVRRDLAVLPDRVGPDDGPRIRPVAVDALHGDRGSYLNDRVRAAHAQEYVD
jgi:hypothetical protein